MKETNDYRIVLVEPQHPGNIGAAARAMKSMGLNDLVLVAPQAFPHADATARAAGADDVLGQARIVPCLQEAVSDCQLVIGASARPRRLNWQNLTPRSAATEACALAQTQGKTALVFGRERSGLSNDELDLCHRHLMIPANPEYASLNLAAAVQVVCYELRMATLDIHAGPAANEAAQPEPQVKPGPSKPGPSKVGERDDWASAGDIEGFYTHLQDVLVASDFLDPEQPKLLMRRLRRLFNRAQLEVTEVNILRGILAALDPRKKRSQ